MGLHLHYNHEPVRYLGGDGHALSTAAFLSWDRLEINARRWQDKRRKTIGLDKMSFKEVVTPTEEKEETVGYRFLLEDNSLTCHSPRKYQKMCS